MYRSSDDYTGRELQCQRCGHTWHARATHKPIQCPRCKSTTWDNQPTIQEAAPVYITEGIRMGEIVMTGSGPVTRQELWRKQMMIDWDALIAPGAGWGDAEKSPDEMLAEIRSGWRILNIPGDEDAADELSD